MSIILTQNAKKKIKEQLDKRGKGLGIRIGVKKSGCNGFSYVMDFVDEPTADTFIDADGYPVFINQDASVYLNGMTIDYVKQGLNEKFEFINPNEKNRCGCGESFNV